MYFIGKDGLIFDYSWKMVIVIGGVYFVFVVECFLKFVFDNCKVDIWQFLKYLNMILFIFFFVKCVILYCYFLNDYVFYNFIFIIL